MGTYKLLSSQRKNADWLMLCRSYVGTQLLWVHECVNLVLYKRYFPLVLSPTFGSHNLSITSTWMILDGKGCWRCPVCHWSLYWPLLSAPWRVVSFCINIYRQRNFPNEVWELHLSDSIFWTIKTLQEAYHVQVILLSHGGRTSRALFKNRHIDQQQRIKDPDVSPHTYWTYYLTKPYIREKTTSLTNGVG